MEPNRLVLSELWKPTGLRFLQNLKSNRRRQIATLATAVDLQNHGLDGFTIQPSKLAQGNPELVFDG